MARRTEPLIRRVDHNHFHGRASQVKRGDRVWRKYFSDKPDGATAALRRARAWRDRKVDALPAPVKVKRTFILNKTGFIGVTVARDISKSGKVNERYAASLPLAEGGSRKQSFAVGKYGRHEALRLAIEARRKGVAKLMADRKRGIRKRR